VLERKYLLAYGRSKPLTILKISTLWDYAQAHRCICCVLNGLQPPYGWTHESYDQTHGSYAQAHVPLYSTLACKYMNLKFFAELSNFSAPPIWYGLWFG